MDSLDADAALLLMAMQTLCHPKEDHTLPATELYKLAKHGCRYAEDNNIISLRLLQAHLLIAVYELGNAIYPAAYLTVGHCARLGYALGINSRKDAPQMLPKPGKPPRTLVISMTSKRESKDHGQRQKRGDGHGGL